MYTILHNLDLNVIFRTKFALRDILYKVLNMEKSYFLFPILPSFVFYYISTENP